MHTHTHTLFSHSMLPDFGNCHSLVVKIKIFHIFILLVSWLVDELQKLYFSFDYGINQHYGVLLFLFVSP